MQKHRFFIALLLAIISSAQTSYAESTPDSIADAVKPHSKAIYDINKNLHENTLKAVETINKFNNKIKILEGFRNIDSKALEKMTKEEREAWLSSLEDKHIHTVSEEDRKGVKVETEQSRIDRLNDKLN